MPQRDRGVALAARLLVTDLPRPVGQLVDGEVPDPAPAAGAQLHDRHHQQIVVRRRVTRSTTVTSASSPTSMTSRGNAALPTTWWLTTIGCGTTVRGGIVTTDRVGRRRC